MFFKDQKPKFPWGEPLTRIPWAVSTSLEHWRSIMISQVFKPCLLIDRLSCYLRRAAKIPCWWRVLWRVSDWLKHISHAARGLLTVPQVFANVNSAQFSRFYISELLQPRPKGLPAFQYWGGRRESSLLSPPFAKREDPGDEVGITLVVIGKIFRKKKCYSLLQLPALKWLPFLLWIKNFTLVQAGAVFWSAIISRLWFTQLSVVMKKLLNTSFPW